MGGIRALLTARRLSLGIMVFLAAMMYLSTIVPQAPECTPEKISEWRRGHEGIVWLLDGAGLHTIFSQPWFAAATLLAAASLAISCRDQLRSARRRLHATAVGGAEQLHTSVAEARLRQAAAGKGYRPLSQSPAGELKFVRNRAGYFGNTLLHAGMALAVCGSLYVALTGRQGALILVEGDRPQQGAGWAAARHGMLTTPLPLPGAVRLDKVSLSVDDKNRVNGVSSYLTISRPHSEPEHLSAEINRISSYHGLRVHHSAQYGDAFTLEFVDRQGNAHYEKIPIQHPKEPAAAGYGDFDLKWTPLLLSAKYYPDADGKAATGGTPLLVLRLLDRQREVARVRLTPGAEATLGDYRVRLLAAQKWANLIFVDVTGMPIVFAGFAICVLGGLLHYLAPPREIIALKGDGGYRVYWKGVSFRDFFTEERDELAVALVETAEDGIVFRTVPEC